MMLGTFQRAIYLLDFDKGKKIIYLFINHILVLAKQHIMNVIIYALILPSIFFK